ncbi:MAG: hypothetical protein S0880_08900 [Actinomycetota bacterium]|nr:hypothetical protein [Actinomycetota bacterium]
MPRTPAGWTVTHENDVDDLLAAIRHHWVFARGLRPSAADEMHEELRDHLADARADGRTIDDVVGDDLLAFADDWADQRGDTPRWRRPLEIAGVLALWPFVWTGAMAQAEGTLQPSVSLLELAGFAVIFLVWVAFTCSRITSPLRPAVRRAFTYSNYYRATGLTLIGAAIVWFATLALLPIDGWAITVPTAFGLTSAAVYAGGLAALVVRGLRRRSRARSTR